jgi:hypothetical protein
MQLFNERKSEDTIFDIELSDEEYQLLVEHAEANMSEHELTEFKCQWAILSILKHAVDKETIKVGDRVVIIDPGGELVLNRDSVKELLEGTNIDNYWCSNSPEELMYEYGTVVLIKRDFYFIQLENIDHTVAFVKSEIFDDKNRIYIEKDCQL